MSSCLQDPCIQVTGNPQCVYRRVLRIAATEVDVVEALLLSCAQLALLRLQKSSVMRCDFPKTGSPHRQRVFFDSSCPYPCCFSHHVLPISDGVPCIPEGELCAASPPCINVICLARHASESMLMQHFMGVLFLQNPYNILSTNMVLSGIFLP